jgi:type VI secretion system protein ImpF
VGLQEPRPIRGARAPLFERFIEKGSLAPGPNSASSHVLDYAELRESVRREIDKLLNTRASPSIAIRTLAEGTVIGYGCPQFAPFCAVSETDREALGQLIAGKIAFYEPRLHDVHVTLRNDSNDPRILTGTVQASLVVGSVYEPVAFPLLMESHQTNIR